MQHERVLSRCIPCFCRNSTLTAKDSNSSGMLHIIADKLCVLLDNFKEKKYYHITVTLKIKGM